MQYKQITPCFAHCFCSSSESLQHVPVSCFSAAFKVSTAILSASASRVGREVFVTVAKKTPSVMARRSLTWALQMLTEVFRRKDYRCRGVTRRSLIRASLRRSNSLSAEVLSVK